jgi:signal transduction histidine kinase
MVNHELRNSLAAVYGWSEMLVRKKDPAQVPRAAFEVLDSAQQAVGLINDLLDMSRMDEDRLKPVIRPIEPGGVVRRAIGRVTPAADARNVSLEVEVEPGLPACDTDASRLEQILMNLLGNAVQHTPLGSTVRVRVEPTGRRVVFTVVDEGPGIAASEVERIFDIYASKKEEGMQGVGLGLPLSRRLARLMGGELRALAADGRGGRFVLELPASPES